MRIVELCDGTMHLQSSHFTEYGPVKSDTIANGEGEEKGKRKRKKRNRESMILGETVVYIHIKAIPESLSVNACINALVDRCWRLL